MDLTAVVTHLRLSDDHFQTIRELINKHSINLELDNCAKH